MIRRRLPLAAVVAFAALAVCPVLAQAARPVAVTRGLDYLHAQQVASTGGFSSPSATGWAILGLVASGERVGSSAWTKGGKNPIKSLQAINQDAAATADLNPPVYYAQMILSYMAGGREDYVYAAGTPAVDLLTRLYSYQDAGADSPTKGSFSPSSSNRSYKAVRTTSWAILALNSLGIDNDSFTSALAWLRTQQNADGGFPVNAGGSSNTTDTALAIQALRAARASADADLMQKALAYLDGVQRSDGGFADQETSTSKLDADATTFAIQAIDAAGEDPAAGRWRTSSGSTPLAALRGLQVKRGAFALHPGALVNPVQVTGRALVGLSRQNLVTYPAHKPKAVRPFAYRPQIDNIKPKGGSTFKTTRIVLISARYGDGRGGTGVNVDAVRLYVDSANKTKPADVGRFGLHLQLKDIPNGKHAYRIVVRDLAGNERQVERSFTVAVPIAPPFIPTHRPTPVVTPITPPPTYHPTTAPTATPSSSTTLYPTPTSSPSAYPSPTPSSSGSPITGAPVGSTSGPGGGGSTGASGGSAAGFLGGTLLAMLPLGAALTYYLLRRREDLMAASAVGETLPGGGSPWEHLKSAFGRSKDLVKPARS